MYLDVTSVSLQCHFKVVREINFSHWSFDAERSISSGALVSGRTWATLVQRNSSKQRWQVMTRDDTWYPKIPKAGPKHHTKNGISTSGTEGRSKSWAVRCCTMLFESSSLNSKLRTPTQKVHQAQCRHGHRSVSSPQFEWKFLSPVLQKPYKPRRNLRNSKFNFQISIRNSKTQVLHGAIQVLRHEVHLIAHPLGSTRLWIAHSCGLRATHFSGAATLRRQSVNRKPIKTADGINGGINGLGVSASERPKPTKGLLEIASPEPAYNNLEPSWASF